MPDTIIYLAPQQNGIPAALKVTDNGDGTYALKVTTSGGGAPSTAGEPIGLLLILTKAS